MQVWTVLGRKALDTEMSEWDNSAQDYQGQLEKMRGEGFGLMV